MARWKEVGGGGGTHTCVDSAALPGCFAPRAERLAGGALFLMTAPLRPYYSTTLALQLTTGAALEPAGGTQLLQCCPAPTTSTLT